MFQDNMPDYSKSIIYTIRTRDGLYVGSTTNFTKRKYHHKCYIKKKSNRKLYKTICDNDGEWDMKPYKEFPCENITQLNIEEERIRCELKADLNMNLCNGFDMERRKETRKNWRKNNLEKERERSRRNRMKNKD